MNHSGIIEEIKRPQMSFSHVFGGLWELFSRMSTNTQLFNKSVFEVPKTGVEYRRAMVWMEDPRVAGQRLGNFPSLN